MDPPWHDGAARNRLAERRVEHDVLRKFNKRMFFFFGPPQLGRPAPEPVVDRDPVCPRCGRRESEHTIFRDASKSFAQCPSE